jgi:hypothetical protein
MARYGITKPLGNTKPENVFESSQAAFKNIGWEVYKLRSIAFLVEARTTGDGDEGYVLANLIATAFGNPEIKLTLKGDNASEETLKKYADQIMEALEKELLRKK